MTAAEAIHSAVATVRETGEAVEIAGVRIERCDEYGQTETTRRADAAEQTRDHWEREAKGMATECREVSDTLAVALGYPDMRHTDAPLGVVISSWLAQEAARRLAAAGHVASGGES